MLKIGPQIKRIRKIKKISLTELSQNSGVQIATLSRIENEKMTGTLECHFMIAKALGVDLTELYQGMQDEKVSPVPPEETIEAISAPNEKVSREILSRQATSKKMLPTLINMDAHASSHPEKLPNGTERFIYVLDGAVIAHIKDQSVKLGAQTSLYFNAALPHYFENVAGSPAKVLSVMTPVIL